MPQIPLLFGILATSMSTMFQTYALYSIISTLPIEEINTTQKNNEKVLNEIRDTLYLKFHKIRR